MHPLKLVGLLTTLPTAPTAKREMLCLERHQDGASSCALHLICALVLHSLDPRRVIGSILPLGNVGTCFQTVCVGCDLREEDGSTTSLAAT